MDLTVFITTIGNEVSFRRALHCLEAQTVRFRLEIIDRVAPLSAAFQQMLDRCRTPYYVQVDEDMLLFPHAIETLYDRMTAASLRVAMVYAPLWDCDVEAPIYGVKIYRHRIVRRFPYENTFSCEKTQLQKIRAAGYQARSLPLERAFCLGEHGKHYTPRTIFLRWRRLLQKQRRYQTLSWVERQPALLLDRYIATRNPLHLYAFLGAVAGIVGSLPPDREADFRKRCPDFERLAGYFPPQ